MGAVVGPCTWSLSIEPRASDDAGPLNVLTAKHRCHDQFHFFATTQQFLIFWLVDVRWWIRVQTTVLMPHNQSDCEKVIKNACFFHHSRFAMQHSEKMSCEFANIMIKNEFPLVCHQVWTLIYQNTFSTNAGNLAKWRVNTCCKHHVYLLLLLKWSVISYQVPTKTKYTWVEMSAH